MLYLKDKDKILNIRLSSEMYDYIEKVCADFKMTKADFVRMLIKSHKIKNRKGE